MAKYQTLKAAINAVIKANGNKEITGTVLNEVLLAMVNSLGAGYQFAGVATPSTNPGTPDQNVFYLAGQAGTYTNFNSIALPDGVSILKWNGSWSGETVVAGDGVFDISAYKATGGTLATFADLSAALDGGNNVPQSIRRGGMSVKFVQSSDNKYVQYRLMATSWSTNESNWQSSNPLQQRGTSTTTPMSQKAVTDELKNIEAFLNFTNSEQQTIVDLYTGKYISVEGTAINASHMSVADISLQKNDIIFVKGNFHGTFVPAIMEINSNGTWVKNIEMARSNKDELHIYIADKNIRLALNYVNNTGRPFEIYKGDGNSILYYLQKSLKSIDSIQSTLSSLQGNVSMHDTLIGLFANNQFTKVDVSSLEVETGKYYNVDGSKVSAAGMDITTLPLLQGETAFINADCYDSFVAAIKYGNKIVATRGDNSNLYIFTASSDIDIYISHKNTKPFEIYKGNGNGILYYLNQNIKNLSSIATVVSDLQSELADLRDFSTYADPQFISQGNGFVNWYKEPKIQVGQPINFGSFAKHNKYLIPAGTRAYIKWTEHSGGGVGYANAICDANDIVLEFIHNNGAPSTPTEYEHIFSKRDVDTYLYTTSGVSEGPTVTKIIIDEDIKEAIIRQGEEISELEELVKIIDFSDKVVLIEGDSTSDEGGPNGTGHSWGYYMNLVLKFKRKINIAKSMGTCRDRTSSTSGVTKSPQWAPDAGNNFISYFGASDPYYPVQGSTESGTENYDQMTANNCLYSHTGYLFKLIQDGNIPTPDVYLMNLCGINDTWAGSSTTEAQIRAIIGSVEDIRDIDNFETIQRNTIVNAITWSVQKIRKNYPSIQIIGITPVQQSKGNHNHFYLVYEELKKLFNYLSMPTIDVYGGCGIQKDLENKGSVAAGNIYTNDGTHPNGIGYTREGKFIAANLKSIIFV